jgi:hypothetical protein
MIPRILLRHIPRFTWLTMQDITGVDFLRSLPGGKNPGTNCDAILVFDSDNEYLFVNIILDFIDNGWDGNSTKVFLGDEIENLYWLRNDSFFCNYLRVSTDLEFNLYNKILKDSGIYVDYENYQISLLENYNKDLFISNTRNSFLEAQGLELFHQLL